MLKRFARLFVIKTRFEACLVIYAIAMGAIVRGAMFMQQYPGLLGQFMFLCCLGVVFIAGAKLFDAVRPREPAIQRGPWRVPTRHQRSASLRNRRAGRGDDQANRRAATRRAVR